MTFASTQSGWAGSFSRSQIGAESGGGVLGHRRGPAQADIPQRHLGGLEFRADPPADHDGALRRRVAAHDSTLAVLVCPDGARGAAHEHDMRSPPRVSPWTTQTSGLSVDPLFHSRSGFRGRRGFFPPESSGSHRSDAVQGRRTRGWPTDVGIRVGRPPPAGASSGIGPPSQSRHGVDEVVGTRGGERPEVRKGNGPPHSRSSREVGGPGAMCDGYSGVSPFVSTSAVSPSS